MKFEKKLLTSNKHTLITNGGKYQRFNSPQPAIEVLVYRNIFKKDEQRIPGLRKILRQKLFINKDEGFERLSFYAWFLQANRKACLYPLSTDQLTEIFEEVWHARDSIVELPNVNVSRAYSLDCDIKDRLAHSRADDLKYKTDKEAETIITYLSTIDGKVGVSYIAKELRWNRPKVYRYLKRPDVAEAREKLNYRIDNEFTDIIHGHISSTPLIQFTEPTTTTQPTKNKQANGTHRKNNVYRLRAKIRSKREKKGNSTQLHKCPRLAVIQPLRLQERLLGVARILQSGRDCNNNLRTSWTPVVQWYNIQRPRRNEHTSSQAARPAQPRIYDVRRSILC